MGDIKARPNYCVRAPGLLKWIQMIFACIILGLILYDYARDKNLWDNIKEGMENFRKDDKEKALSLDGYIIRGEQYTILVAVICLIMNLIFLIIFFLSCHSGPCVGCPCFSLAAIYYGASFLIWLAAGGVEVYAAIAYRDSSETIFEKVKEKLGDNYQQECFGRRAAAAALCFLNALLYLGSLQQAKYQDL